MFNWMKYSSRFNAPFTDAERKLTPRNLIKKIWYVVKVVEVILRSPVGTCLLDCTEPAEAMQHWSG